MVNVVDVLSQGEQVMVEFVNRVLLCCSEKFMQLLAATK